MTRALPVVLMLGLSGCCCALPASVATGPWKNAVAREKNNPQIYALEAGTLNVFEVEVQYPRGWTQADEDAAGERAALREVRRLQELLIAHGVDAGTLQELSPPPGGPMQTSERVRFSLLHPRGALEDSLSGGECAPCRDEAARHHAVLLTSFGWAPLNLQTVTSEQLMAGVDVNGGVTVRSPGDAEDTSVSTPSEGTVRLKLIESCPATVAFLSGSVRAGNGSGVIAVPQYQERSWYELRDARCGGGGVTTRELSGPQFKNDARAPSQSKIWELRAQLRDLGVTY